MIDTLIRGLVQIKLYHFINRVKNVFLTPLPKLDLNQRPYG
jgi:hypothetical protein